MGVVKSSLIVALVDQVTGKSKAMRKSFRDLKQGAVDSTGTIQGRLNASLGNAQKNLHRTRMGMVDAVAGFYALRAAIGSPIRAAREFESAMADVAKVVTEFEDTAKLDAFGKEILKLGNRLPIATKELAGIAAAAAQSGVATKDLIEFTELVAKASVAFQTDSETMGAALAKLKTALKLDIPGVQLLAGQMNILANNMATTEKDVLEVVRRVAALGGVSGVSSRNIAAMGAAMSSAGVDAEVASTAIRNMLIELSSGKAATKSTRMALKELGLDAEQVAKDMQKDGPGTILNIFDRIENQAPHVRNAILTALFGKRAVDAVGPLLANLDNLRKAMKLVGDDAKSMEAVDKEFAVRARVFDGIVQQFTNQIENLKIAIGTSMLPALSSIIGAISPVVLKLGELAQTYPQLTTAIVGATTALIAFRVAGATLAFSGAQAKVALLQMALGFTKLGAAAKFVALAPMGAALKRLAGTAQLAGLRFKMMGREWKAGTLGMSGAAKGTFATLSRALVGLLNPIGLVRGALTLLKVALIGTGIGAVLVGIASAGTLIYNNWTGIKEMFSGFAKGFTEAMGPLPELLRPVTGLVSTLFDKVSGMLGPINATKEEWHSWGETLGRVAGGGARMLLDFIQSIIDKVNQLIGVAKKAASAIAGIFSRSGSDNAKAATSGFKNAHRSRRATGGPVKAGREYIVNDDVNAKGPETFIPGRSGTIKPADRGNKQTAVAPVVHQTNHIHLGAGSDRNLVQTIRDVIRDANEESFRGIYGDAQTRHSA